ncbi:MAG: GDSL-type esterase/lipase family protein [Paludibacter sp.]|nr:GDSL-type esterase/lipase family protein [Paludibacter sp.]
MLCVFFPKEGIKFFGHSFFFPTFEDVMVRDKNSSAAEKMQILERELLMSEKQNKARSDSVIFFKNFFNTHPAAFVLPDNKTDFFDDFFEQIEKCCSENTAVHIMHYGDSQIEMDRISGILRQRLQERFGGFGAGLMPAVQIIPSSAVNQSSTDNINRYVISGQHRNRASHNRYGALGQVAQVNGSGTISFGACNYGRTFSRTKHWSQVRVFLGQHSKSFQTTLLAGTLQQKQKVENMDNKFSILTWTIDSTKRTSLNFSGSTEVLGIALESHCGVFVDNIPLRGSSGTFFSQIDRTSIAFMYNALNVKLIFLQFGGNMMPQINSQKTIDTYMENMAGQIQFLHQLAPQAKIVLIGPADMSKKVKGKLQTYPLLPELVESMERTANQNNAAFWNIFKVMGGSGSMIDWVRDKPALAAPDYIHFTSRGADKIGEILFDSMMKYYDFYKLRQKS